MKIRNAQCGSRKHCVWSLLVLCVVVYLTSLGSYLLTRPEMIITGIPGAVMFGWLFLPASLAHNLTGWTGEHAPSWGMWGVAAYWIAVLGLVAAFIVKRRWIIFAAVSVLMLLSAKGCYHFANIQDWRG